MKNAELTELKSFLSGYFHEDWECDAAEPEQAIAHYLNSNPEQNTVESIVAQIEQFMTVVGIDTNVGERLLLDLGCYYLPSADGLSIRDWLSKVADQLRSFLANH